MLNRLLRRRTQWCNLHATQRRRCFSTGINLPNEPHPSITPLLLPARNNNRIPLVHPQQSSISSFHPSFKTKTGYHRPFRFTFLRRYVASRPAGLSVNLRKRSRAAFGRGEHSFSSSTVGSRRGGPTFLSLRLRLRQSDLVCLFNRGLNDLLLFGGERGGELGVELGLGL